MLKLKSETIHQQYKRAKHILAVFNDSDKTADDLSNRIDRLIYHILLIIKQQKGITLYPEQIIAALNLIQNKIIEMHTGEGKTYAGVMAAIIMIKLEQKQHIQVITTNDYLAHRDYLNLSPIYYTLGISTGLVTADTKLPDKIKQYAQQVVFTTDEELGFDYLRDQTELRPDQIRLPKLEWALIDEADNILLDNSRSPLILASGQTQSFTEIKAVQKFVSTLVPHDYTVKPDENSVFLSKQGEQKLTKYITENKIRNKQYLLMLVNTALSANFLLKLNSDYIIINKHVVLINSDTGRISSNRQFTDGMTQALEAKHDLPITAESKISQKITYPALFRLYDNFAGMTGTAYTSRKEFKSLYLKSVVRIPSHYQNKRIDEPDKLYLTLNQRNQAILKDVAKYHAKHIPVLLQTTDFNQNKLIADLLSDAGYKPIIFNGKSVVSHTKTKSAKNSTDFNPAQIEFDYQKEAEIVKKIGQPDAITIATNIAGRGTDIKLAKSVSTFRVIGVSRSRNRRLDEQFLGRSGRQGKTGSSCFYLSLEDDLIKYFARKHLLLNTAKLRDKISKNVDSTGLISGRPRQIIIQAENKLTDLDLSQRQNLDKYDQINEIFRQQYSHIRQAILLDNTNTELKSVLKRINNIFASQIVDPVFNNRNDVQLILQKYSKSASSDFNSEKSKQSKKQIKHKYLTLNQFMADYENQLLNNNSSDINFSLKKIILQIIDHSWSDFISEEEQIEWETMYYSFADIKSEDMYTIKLKEVWNKLILKTAEKISDTIVKHWFEENCDNNYEIKSE